MLQTTTFKNLYCTGEKLLTSPVSDYFFFTGYKYTTLTHYPMDPNPTRITHDFPPFFRVFTTGRVERYRHHDFVPPSHDLKTGVVSKDVVISPENNVSARLYLPQTTENDRKLPLILYIHGGSFSTESAFSSLYHPYANSLASESRSVVVSIEYRLAPEHRLPACYDDCFEVLKWIDLHSRVGIGPDPWLNEYADFGRVHIAGDGAGANIAHNIAIRANSITDFIKIEGLILIHPFFGIGMPDMLWNFICPGTSGADDVRLNPLADISKLGCGKVLICVGQRDYLKERGWYYYQGLMRSRCGGFCGFFESPGEEHVFHLFDPECSNAVLLMKGIVKIIRIQVSEMEERHRHMEQQRREQHERTIKAFYKLLMEEPNLSSQSKQIAEELYRNAVPLFGDPRPISICRPLHNSDQPTEVPLDRGQQPTEEP